jgi:hypothetical protein
LVNGVKGAAPAGEERQCQLVFEAADGVQRQFRIEIEDGPTGTAASTSP